MKNLPDLILALGGKKIKSSLRQPSPYMTDVSSPNPLCLCGLKNLNQGTSFKVVSDW